MTSRALASLASISREGCSPFSSYSLFRENSYGYRPLKSAHQAVEQVRKNSYKYDWVFDMDIQKFFDEIDHELMLKAMTYILKAKWVKMYMERWLAMPIMRKEV